MPAPRAQAEPARMRGISPPAASSPPPVLRELRSQSGAETTMTRLPPMPALLPALSPLPVQRRAAWTAAV